MIKLLTVFLVICEVIYAAPPYNLFANSSDQELVLLGKKFDELVEILEHVLSRQKQKVEPVDDVEVPIESEKGLLSSSPYVSSGNKLSLIERIRNRLTTTTASTTSSTTTTGSSTTSLTTTTTTTMTPPAAG